MTYFGIGSISFFQFNFKRLWSYKQLGQDKLFFFDEAFASHKFIGAM